MLTDFSNWDWSNIEFSEHTKLTQLLFVYIITSASSSMTSVGPEKIMD